MQYIKKFLQYTQLMPSEQRARPEGWAAAKINRAMQRYYMIQLVTSSRLPKYLHAQSKKLFEECCKCRPLANGPTTSVEDDGILRLAGPDLPKIRRLLRSKKNNDLDLLQPHGLAQHSVMHVAAQRGYTELVRELLAHWSSHPMESPYQSYSIVLLYRLLELVLQIRQIKALMSESSASELHEVVTKIGTIPFAQFADALDQLRDDAITLQDLLRICGHPLVLCKDASGNTLLHYATEGGYLSLCQLLIEHGAKINAQNKSDETPYSAFRDLEFACRRVHAPGQTQSRRAHRAVRDADLVEQCDAAGYAGRLAPWQRRVQSHADPAVAVQDECIGKPYADVRQHLQVATSNGDHDDAAASSSSEETHVLQAREARGLTQTFNEFPPHKGRRECHDTASGRGHAHTRRVAFVVAAVSRSGSAGRRVLPHGTWKFADQAKRALRAAARRPRRAFGDAQGARGSRTRQVVSLAHRESAGRRGARDGFVPDTAVSMRDDGQGARVQPALGRAHEAPDAAREAPRTADHEEGDTRRRTGRPLQASSAAATPSSAAMVRKRGLAWHQESVQAAAQAKACVERAKRV
ncbi:Ca2-permeable cation channel protein, partial [Globisporangium splendens]